MEKVPTSFCEVGTFCNISSIRFPIANRFFYKAIAENPHYIDTQKGEKPFQNLYRKCKSNYK